METKRCCECGDTKPLLDFGKERRRKDGLNPRCKPCNRARASAWIKANPERRRENQRRNVRENSDRYLDGYLKRNYGITLQNYKDMLAKQEGLCAICRTDQPGGRVKFFSVDHCHATGKVRGLLCYHCNLALGHFKDNLSVVRSAIDYLEATTS